MHLTVAYIAFLEMPLKDLTWTRKIVMRQMDMETHVFRRWVVE